MNRLNQLLIVLSTFLAMPLASQVNNYASSEVFALYSNGEFDKALDHGRQLLKSYPNDPALLFYTAESARRLRYYPLAETFF